MSKQTSSQIDLDKFYCQHKCLLYKVENENCVIIYLYRYSSVNAMKFIDDVVVGFMFIICVLYWLSYDIICAYAICSSISSLLFQKLSCTEKNECLADEADARRMMSRTTSYFVGRLWWFRSLAPYLIWVLLLQRTATDPHMIQTCSIIWIPGNWRKKCPEERLMLMLYL